MGRSRSSPCWLLGKLLWPPLLTEPWFKQVAESPNPGAQLQEFLCPAGRIQVRESLSELQAYIFLDSHDTVSGLRCSCEGGVVPELAPTPFRSLFSCPLILSWGQRQTVQALWPLGTWFCVCVCLFSRDISVEIALKGAERTAGPNPQIGSGKLCNIFTLWEFSSRPPLFNVLAVESWRRHAHGAWKHGIHCPP